jgi:hypothetical protein
MMTVRYLPNVGNNALFLVSAGKGVLYLLDALAGTVSETYDAKVGEGHCVMTLPFRNTSRIMMSIYTSNQVRHLGPRCGWCQLVFKCCWLQCCQMHYAHGVQIANSFSIGCRACTSHRLTHSVP